MRTAEFPQPRSLYVSLTGTERTEWKRSLAALGAATFAAGLLIGAGIAGVVASARDDDPPTQPEQAPPA